MTSTARIACAGRQAAASTPPSGRESAGRAAVAMFVRYIGTLRRPRCAAPARRPASSAFSKVNEQPSRKRDEVVAPDRPAYQSASPPRRRRARRGSAAHRCAGRCRRRVPASARPGRSPRAAGRVSDCAGRRAGNPRPNRRAEWRDCLAPCRARGLRSGPRIRRAGCARARRPRTTAAKSGAHSLRPALPCGRNRRKASAGARTLGRSRRCCDTGCAPLALDATGPVHEDYRRANWPIVI